MKLTIDGKQVIGEKGKTVLECALEHGIEIPHLCAHPHLEPYGACRMCIVEIEGMRGYPTSCTTPATDGMVVHTNTQALQNLRRDILTLMMLEHPSACLTCQRREMCEQYRPEAEKAGRTTGCHTCNNKDVCEVRALSKEIGLSDLPVPPQYRHLPLDRSNPCIDRDLNLCILCGRCVRICKHHHGWGVIDFVKRGSKTVIGQAFGRSLVDAGCQFCGACVDVCPTGAMADRYAKWYGKPDSSTDSTCMFCGAACALKLGESQGKLVTAEALYGDFPICVLGRFALPEFLNAPDRLRVPYVRVGKILREVMWEQALNTAAEKLKEFVGPGFALICDQTSLLEDRYLFRKFTRDVMKSPHYIEIAPDELGVSSLSTLPDGVKAAMLMGSFIDPAELKGVDLLIVQDIFPSALSDRADIVLPVAVFAEVDGTTHDGTGVPRPLRRACTPAGQTLPEWQIIARLAQKMDAAGFDYPSVEPVTQEMGIPEARLFSDRTEAPVPSLDLRQRRTHFRGHRIDAKVSALRELPLAVQSDVAAVPVAAVARRGEGFVILQKSEIAPNVHEIVIEAPHIAKKALPGQFVIVMTDETSERVPFTLCDWDEQKGTITLVVLEVGQSSRKLALTQTGDRLAHVAGPLGIPLEIKPYGTVMLAGGCYGIGAILLMARSLKQAGNRVIGVVEARSHYSHYYADKLSGVCDQLVQTTTDGSLGIRGHAVDAIIQRLKDQESVDLVVAVGCPFMMMITSKETQPFGVKTMVALNPIMLDGTGMCGACRVTVGGATRFACVDGPFFDGHQVDWEELRDRRVAYRNEEIDVVGHTAPVVPHPSGHRCQCV
ncbi:MAG: sulfide/dihydroorotate dehydrogenase-like FAD/NAD-binding protein [Dehalococcoidia bacterium]|nr:sulfide/dihydroorotate dehydrogenase-like FAD/NAD-binding protein [Dehalococcoidia bacterium]